MKLVKKNYLNKFKVIQNAKKYKDVLTTLIAAILLLALQNESSTCVFPSPVHVIFRICTPCPQTPFLKEEEKQDTLTILRE